MDFNMPEPETFPGLEKEPWMSESEMSQFAGMIIDDGGYAGRTGQATQFDIKKQVGANLVSLSMIVRADFVAVVGNIQPGLQDLFKAEDWNVIKDLAHDGPEHFENYQVDLPTYVTVSAGDGYNPYFEFFASDKDMLAAFVLRVFKVEIDIHTAYQGIEHPVFTYADM